MLVAMTAASNFDEATALSATSEPAAGGQGGGASTRTSTGASTRYAAQISDRYNIGPVPNGGYLMSLVQRALDERLPGKAPLTLTTHFLRPAVIAPAQVEVEVLKEGKRYTTARARLWQGADEVVSSIATMATMATAPAGAGAAGTGAAGAAAAGGAGGAGGRAPSPSPRFVSGGPPELLPLERVVVVPATDFYRIGHQFEMRLDPACAGWMTGAPSGVAEMRGYIRFVDGRAPDAVSLPLFCDAVMPAIFGLVRPRHVPTLEMTVHFRGRPAPGWLRFSFRTRFAFGGHLEEDGELWDESGELVAQSRQLAVLASL